MSDRPIGMATPTVEELEAEIERLQLEADCAGKNAAKYHDIIREQRREIERLRVVLQRIADLPVDGCQSTIPVRAIARVALEDDDENDDTDGTGVNTDWLRDDAGR